MEAGNSGSSSSYPFLQEIPGTARDSMRLLCDQPVSRTLLMNYIHHCAR